MNIKLLEATKQSIAADPDFNLASWDHCIAGHICRAAGVLINDGWVAGEENATHVATEAKRLAGVGGIPGIFYRGDHSEEWRNKQVAYDRIDAIIAEHRQEIEYLAEELVGA